MTSARPPAGIQRQPQRSLSGTGFIQRPAPHRAHSQQYQSSSSPVRKNESYVDLTLEGSESGLGRYAGSSRIGGSRLKDEISKDTAKGAIILHDSPKAVEALPEPQPAPVIRGRPKWHLDGSSQQLQGTNEGPLLSSVRGGENITGHAPLPMPMRPGQNGSPLVQREKALTAHSAAKKDARPKPYVLEVPSAAPRYPPNGHTDFFPWTGNHPEDQFTDHVIRQGFFDKTQTTQNETGSARMSIFPAMKHKSGLQTLSSLFTTVLAQRRTHGQITSTPTFKPPPRVTLTDTKRETWLRDLANPSISLRRLSRTIPHGIRGKILLEQCLSKKIPTERAVWLAKCVGANEIRAFKRKGVTGTFAMGGEAKWIRDWTAFVEQFIESIIGSCGEKDWRERILYAVRLAAHLYSEHLLDREHYLDWLSASLDGCLLAKAPMWLLITQVYWKDLLRSRKYGRRLVAALCAHLQTIHDVPDRDLLQPLLERLTLLLKGLMEKYPESFVSPKNWAKYKQILELYVYPSHHTPSAVYNSIEARNSRLFFSSNELAQSQCHQIVSVLDRSLLTPFTNDTPKQCWDLTTDRPLLLRTVLEWATSSHRPGVAKVFVGARILRIYSRYDIDLNDEILAYLGSKNFPTALNKANLYHLVSELTRSSHFSTSKYIQWLIARGGIRGPPDLAENAPPSTRLLVELPIHDTSERLDRLRRTLFVRAQLDLDDEIEEIETQVGIIKASLSDMVDPDGIALNLQQDSRSFEEARTRRPGFNRAIKSEIGGWLRNLVSSQMAHYKSSPTVWKTEVASVASTSITLDDFNTVRQILEEIEDISMLADVLQIVSNSDDIAVLASVADTLSLNIHSLAAIGALKDLFEKLLARMRSLAELQDLDTAVLLKSLHEVAVRMAGAETVAFQLSQELMQSSRKTAANACSPVSDYMAEVLQNAESEFSDEIEKVLASGTSMDHSTLDRLFHMIMARMEASWYKTPMQQRSCALLLVQLRTFDTKQFGSLLSGWLRSIMESSTRPTLTQSIGPLIAIGCMDFQDVLKISAAILDTTHDNPMSSRIAFETLSLLVGGPKDTGFMATADAYRLAIKRLQMRLDFPTETLAALRRAIEHCAPSSREERIPLQELCQSQQLHEYLQNLVLIDLDSVAQTLVKPLVKNDDSEVSAVLGQLTSRLLYPQTFPESTKKYRAMACRIESALNSADHLTLPFCQLELQVMFATEKPEGPEDEKDAPDHLEAFERAVDLAVASNNRTWTNIIRTLDVQIARRLCGRAQGLFLSLIPTARSNDSDKSSVENHEQAARLLFVVETTAYSMQATSAQQISSQILEKLNDIWQIASQGDDRQDSLEKWLPMMLDFITLHTPTLDSGKNSSETRSRILLSLSAIILELQSRSENNPSLLERTFDVALLLVDDLPEDARVNCVRALKDKTSDHRIHYIFGYSSLPMDWLQLSQKGKLMPYPLRRWEILSEPTPNVGENDTSISLTLFQARKV